MEREVLAGLYVVKCSFKDHGKTYVVFFGREHPPGFRWLHECYRFAGLAFAELLPVFLLLC